MGHFLRISSYSRSNAKVEVPKTVCVLPQLLALARQVTSKVYSRKPFISLRLSLLTLKRRQGASFLFTMTPLTLTPLASLRISTHEIPRYNLIPNTSIQAKPLLIYHSCLPSSATASSIEAHLKETGVVIPQWRYTMYNVSHFHASTHEVLCVFSGQAKLCMLPGFSFIMTNVDKLVSQTWVNSCRFRWRVQQFQG